jgi:hypothetical protein
MLQPVWKAKKNVLANGKIQNQTVSGVNDLTVIDGVYQEIV